MLCVPVCATAEEASPHTRSGFIFLPALYYTPETELAMGIAPQWYFREGASSDTSRPSTITPLLIFTTKKQVITKVAFDTWLSEERHRVGGEVGFWYFPNKYWGVGNDTPEDNEEDYTPEEVKFKLNAQTRVYGSLNAGVAFEWEHRSLKEIEDGGVLGERTIPGSDGGVVSGGGVFVNWDSRDNVFIATGGSFIQASATFFGEVLGGKFDFDRYNVDARQYFSLGGAHSLALQGFLQSEDGTAPFYLMSLLGGQNLQRGYYEGRYRDRSVLILQAEYRVVPVWRRWGLAAFAGMGAVSKDIGDLRVEDLKYSYGGGARYLLSPEEGMTVRLDFGVGEGSSGFYITLGEAF